MWFRVFAPTVAEVTPAAIAEHLHALGLPVVPHFKGDAHGWTTGELFLPRGSTPVLLARFLTKEDDLRDDLNAFAAELETMDYSPHAAGLMEKVIQTQQLVTLRKPIDAPDEDAVNRVCDELAFFLARQSGGFLQIDRRGWLTADGELLVEEY